jgi:hypothetical protein
MTAPNGRGPAYPIFLVLPQVAARIDSLVATLAPVSSVVAELRTLGIDVYFRSATGMALLALCFDPRLLTADSLGILGSAAASAGAALVDPARLPDRARRRFHEEYLPLYEVRRGGLATVEEAIGALAAELVLASSGQPPVERVEVRFRRGDAWQLARVRSMTREGISIATGTPPRRGDVVDLELTACGIVLLARSTVVGVATGDAAAALGASGFGARFLIAGETERRKLEEILRILGSDKLRSLEPPPRRRAARYPVHWPVFVRSPTLRANLRALDVSRHGMFVGCDDSAAPAAGPVHVTVPIDDGGTPILATARVARAIPGEVAKSRGLPSGGIGIEFTALSQRDEQRFAAFVGRIGRRAERDVVVGASASRLPELTTALSAAGYCTTGVSDASGLVARAAAGARVPDLVVLDSSLVRENPRAIHAARRALAVRLVRLMTIDGDSPSSMRESVDGALL